MYEVGKKGVIELQSPDLELEISTTSVGNILRAAADTLKENGDGAGRRGFFSYKE